MKFVIVSILLLGAVFAAPKIDSRLDQAKECSANVACKLPDCLCSSTNIPGNLNTSSIPQIVLLTFDDAVQTGNYYPYYQKIFNNRLNPDKCPIQGTFFASHEYTNYSLVRDLYNEGHEIALHSISHVPNVTYWQAASTNLMTDEIIGERDLISYFAKIPKEDIKGVRLPFLQMSGDTSFEVMSKNGLLYDCSWPTQIFTDPPLWPYTLEYKTIQDCQIGPCPESSFPKSWVVPMIDWTDDKNVPCSMVDACANIPTDVEGILAFMKRNFKRHYETNKAPFGFFVHAAWFQALEVHFTAYLKFVEYLQSLPDVYIVSVSRMLEWVKNPADLKNLSKPWPKCNEPKKTSCKLTTCPHKKQGEWGEEDRYMTHCEATCPKSYPWVGNPLGNK